MGKKAKATTEVILYEPPVTSFTSLISQSIPSDVHILLNRSALEDVMQKSDNEESGFLTNVQVKQLESILEVMQPLLTVAGE